MWTSIALFTGGIWTPNHFVPLLNNHPSHSSPVTSPNRNITLPSPGQSPISIQCQSQVQTSPIKSPVANSSVYSSPVHSPVANSSVHFSPVLNSSLNSSQVQTPVINVSGQSSPPSTPVDTISDESRNDTTDNNNLQECTEGKTVVSGKWLTSEQLYQYQELNNSNDIFSTVPIGPKSNKFSW